MNFLTPETARAAGLTCRLTASTPHRDLDHIRFALTDCESVNRPASFVAVKGTMVRLDGLMIEVWAAPPAVRARRRPEHERTTVFFAGSAVAARASCARARNQRKKGMA